MCEQLFPGDPNGSMQRLAGNDLCRVACQIKETGV